MVAKRLHSLYFDLYLSLFYRSRIHLYRPDRDDTMFGSTTAGNDITGNNYSIYQLRLGKAGQELRHATACKPTDG